MEYELEVERIIDEIRSANARRVGLQFPEGLKTRAVDVAAEIEDKTGVETIIFTDPSYGGCDLKSQDAEKLGIDFLVHFGHVQYEK